MENKSLWMEKTIGITSLFRFKSFSTFKIRKGKTSTEIEICSENKKAQKRAGKKRRTIGENEKRKATNNCFPRPSNQPMFHLRNYSRF